MSLHKCQKCGIYTMKDFCSKCNEEARSPAPAKFSIEHAKKYGKYRRELIKRAKEEQKKE